MASGRSSDEGDREARALDRGWRLLVPARGGLGCALRSERADALRGPPMIVTKVEQRDWDKKDGSAIVKVTDVTFDDGRTVAGYDLPQQPEAGKALPGGWEVAMSQNNKPYIKVPKTGKG